MKLNCGPTYREKVIAWRQWHPWFAWRPVRVGSRDCRWLETIERRRRYLDIGLAGCWDSEYRVKENS